MYSLNDKIDIAGDWWDSANPDAVIPGQLAYDRHKGIELLINQAFTLLHGAVRPGDPNPQYECIHGTTVKGEAVTLVDAQQFGTSLNIGSGGFRQPGKIHARILIMGAHLPPNFSFPRVSFRVPGLQVWLAKQVISQQMQFDSEDKLEKQQYGLSRIPDEEFQIKAIASKISIQYGWNSRADVYSSVEISIAAWFAIQPDESQQMDWFLEKNEKLLTLVSFISGHIMIADVVQAQIDESNHRVSLLFAGREAQLPKQKNPWEFFLPRTSISVPFSDYCERWFEIAPKVEKAASLARSVIASEDIWLHMEFLSLMQALEGLHRALYDGNYMDDDTYESVQKELKGAIPDSVRSDHKTALISRIKYGNQFSLRKRLGVLTRLLSDKIREHVFGSHKSVPTSWIDTRNYYTHWDDELQENILNNQKMYYANIRLKQFLSILFMHLVGIPASDIEKALTGTSDSAQRLVQVNINERRNADPAFMPQAIMTISSSDDEHDSETTSKPSDGEEDDDNAAS